MHAFDFILVLFSFVYAAAITHHRLCDARLGHGRRAGAGRETRLDNKRLHPTAAAGGAW